MLTICQVESWALEKLKKAGVESANLEADIFLCEVLNKSLPYFRKNDSINRAFLYTHPEYKLSKIQEVKYKKMIMRRAKGEPAAYILGYKEFYGLKFMVNKNVLIPRPETEMVVKEILCCAQNDNKEQILIDVGTGSGCILIALAKSLYNVESIKYYGLDISKKALAAAKMNAKFHKVYKKIKFIKSDLLAFFYKTRTGRDLSLQSHNTRVIITANLPYLSTSIYKKNYQNLKFEPRQALLAGKDGLRYYRELLSQIKNILQITNYKLQITCLLEINPNQKNGISKIIKKNLPFAEIEFKKDLSNRVRVVKIEI